MRRSIPRILALGLLCAATAQASTTVINFNQDPATTTPPQVTSVSGTALWVADQGLAWDSVTNASDGYMKLTDAVGGQQGIVVFQDFDHGSVVEGFTFDCWVRIGNGSSSPADGFSINYARTGPIAFNAGNAAEECTTTGIGVGFDAYQNDAVTDLIALDIWVDGTNILQYPMPILNGFYNDPQSIQTQVGPYVGDGTRDSLGWAHVVVDLKTNGLLSVNYKNTWILTNFATGYVPGPGQLVMGGRTGGSWEVQDVDQITISTVLAQLPVFVAATGIPDGVSVSFVDSGAGVVDLTKPVTMSIDGTPVTPTTIVKNGGATSLSYIGYPVLLTAGTVHTVVASVTDTAGVVVSSGIRNFTVAAYAGVVNPSLAVTGVDPSKVGFRMRTWQSDPTLYLEPNDIAWANDQLAGLHGPNLADTSSFTDEGYFDYTGVANWDFDGHTDGNFNNNNGYTENPWPGLTDGANSIAGIDNSAAEILCFLHFARPGGYTMGVISDDGFSVTVDRNPIDASALMVGSFEGGRGADAGTMFGFVVPTAGYYPFRLMWENGTGGANCEWFSVQPDGTKIVINDLDPTNTTGITAYYGAPALPAYVSRLLPAAGASFPRPDQLIATLTDLGTTVSASPITLTVNGVSVNPVIQQASGVTTVSAPAGYLLPRGNDTAQLVYSTSGGGPFTNTWSFTVGASLPAQWAVTGVDINQPGFRILPWQSGAQPNNIRYTLEQLAGIHGINHADLTTATDGGYIDYANNVINFNINPPGGDSGNFTATANGFADSAFPGLPGDLGDVGNESIRVLAFLQFAQTGTYTMGVNSDDGFVVTAGLNPSDWFAPVVGIADVGRGPTDSLFSFYVASPGIYPFQLIWENGNGSFAGGNGAECEWFLVDSHGVKILLNDPSPTNDTGVVAFFKGPSLPAYVSEFSPAPGATGVMPNGFSFRVTDGSTTVTPGTIGVSLNGVAVTPTISKAGLVTSVGLPVLPAGSNTAQVVYNTSGTGGPFTNTWSFTVITNVQPALDAAWRVTGVSNPGFRLLPWQGGAQPNTIRYTQEQLAGWHGDNGADLSTATDNGYIPYTGVINFDTGANHDGSFLPPDYTDINFPGIPGPDGSTDNSSMDVLTYLNFDHVGAYTLCVNSDDNFAVMVGSNPSDWFAPVIGASGVPGGKGASDVPFSFIVTNTGAYPFRVIWENGGGGCNFEWFAIQPDGTKVLLNDPAAPESTGITPYRTGPALPAYVAAFRPADGATGVAQGDFVIELRNGSTTVNSSCITVLINGVAVTPEIVPQGATTWISLNQPLPPGSTNKVEFSYCTAAGTFSNTWSFVVSTATYATLPANLWTPPGSGSNPGFAMKIFQTPNTNIFNGWYVLPRESDMALDGLYGPNVADLTDYTNNGEMWWPGVINFAQNADATLANGGSFQAPAGFTDAAVPGMGAWDPTSIGGTQGKNDNFAVGVRAFLEFPEAGIWYMGVNSDDCFRVNVGDQGAPGKSPLTILAPASEAGELVSMYTTTQDDGNSGASGFGRNPPTTVPIIAQAVLCNPVDASAPLVNASAIAGHVAVCYRGPSFATQSRHAFDAGAVAVIGGLLTSDLTLPGPRGGTDAGVTIPCLQLGYPDFATLTNHITADTSSPVVVRITDQDCSTVLGQYSYGGGRGPTDTIFALVVPQAGLYPIRLVWDNGGGGSACEWFVIDPDTGLYYLINEPESPVKAWITRNVNAPGALPAPKLNAPVVSGGNVIISWTGEGELWESYSIKGPWFKSTYQANPSTVVQSSFLPERFFRVRQY